MCQVSIGTVNANEENGGRWLTLFIEIPSTFHIILLLILVSIHLSIDLSLWLVFYFLIVISMICKYETADFLESGFQIGGKLCISCIFSSQKKISP
jgi:hypothetical protein